MISSENLLDMAKFMGAGISMGMAAIGASIGVGQAGSVACASTSEQPRGYSEIFRTMLIGQAVTESAAVFALVISLLLIFVHLPGSNFEGAAARLAAGICMGFGAISSGLGAGFVNAEAVRGVGRRPDVSTNMTITMLLAQSVAQSSAIFALIIAFVLAFRGVDGSNIVKVCAILGAGTCMGFGAIGPGIGSGIAGAYSCYATACRLKQRPVIIRTMLLGQAVSQSTAIYSLVIAFMLLFVAV
jgi:F0F1-type ATP synthase membrane subunit c/vacuolar-type H+-ATPase subunit K